jgi:hypothetical protein
MVLLNCFFIEGVLEQGHLNVFNRFSETTFFLLQIDLEDWELYRLVRLQRLITWHVQITLGWK